MVRRLALLLFTLAAFSAPALADAPPALGLRFEPLPQLEVQHLADPDAYAHFECKTRPGPEAAGLYPRETTYPEFTRQEPYSSPNGAFPDSHQTWGGPPGQPDPGPLPSTARKGS